MANLKKIITLFRFVIGLWRRVWGLCPLCNSDAPAIDRCPVCKNIRLWEERRSANRWKRFRLHLGLRAKSRWTQFWQRERILFNLDLQYTEALLQHEWEKAGQIIRRYLNIKYRS